ncbi:UBX domain-containing protein 4 [Aricia agestis]|uniref:UBX domain-containing protein 4 n=1 Tax=Aricia agestis TaxID=91739 RepID=UPI001C20A6DE|nr:UBX domain-containing protein 4 [Aricia agestis]
MHWFGGSIAEAVTLSKQKNAIFVVFVEGDNDLSKELADTIDNELVLSCLDNPDKFLAIKLKSGTDNYTYFAQIYQFVPVPSLFFIGRNGTPLEVVCAGIEAQNLASRIDLIIQEHCKEGTIPSAKPSTSAQSVKEQTQSLLQSEANVNGPKPSNSAAPVSESLKKPSTEDKVGPAAKMQKTDDKPQEYEVVCDGDVCVRKPKDDQAGTSQDTKTQPPQTQEPATEESAASIEEKAQRAKELIEIKKREKAEKEKELERQKELERRSVGQGVAELKRWQAEQELKQLQEERKREKMENALARQRILDQIAQDRAERRAREARDAPQTPPQPQHRVDAGGAVGAGAGSGAATSRLQLKLPDGGAHSVQFPATATLADVRRYIADNLQLPSSQFSLWTAFPRRELTDGDATLSALGLAPSAALLLLPRAQPLARPAPSPAGLIAFLTQLFTTMILDPTYRVYNWLRDQLFPRAGGTGSGAAGERGGAAGGAGERGGAGAGGVRRRGNVHRLAGDRDDDENNTWNGNSTQQM